MVALGDEFFDYEDWLKILEEFCKKNNKLYIKGKGAHPISKNRLQKLKYNSVRFECKQGGIRDSVATEKDTGYVYEVYYRLKKVLAN